MAGQGQHLEDDGVAEREDLLARVHAADAALARLEQLAAEDWVYDDTVGRVRAMLEYRRSRFASRIEGEDSESFEARSAAYQRLLRELLGAQQRLPRPPRSQPAKCLQRFRASAAMN